MGVMLTGSAFHHLTKSINEEYNPIMEEVIVVFITPNAVYSMSSLSVNKYVQFLFSGSLRTVLNVRTVSTQDRC